MRKVLQYSQDVRLDAQENLFFQRQLEQIASKSYDVKYAELKAAKLVPVRTDIDPGTTVYVVYTYDAFGVAKLITAYGDNAPRVDISGVQSLIQMRDYALSFGWNIDEVKKAAKAGLPLEQRKANMARRGLDERLDLVAATGDAQTGALGLANQPNAINYVIPNGASGSPLWANKTPDEILNDMHGIANNIVSTTLDVEKPDTLLLPLDSFTFVASKRADQLNSKTILATFLENNPYIRSVESWVRLTGQGAGGTRRMICYRKDPDAVEFLVSIPFEQLPPEPRNFETIVNCRNKTGGVFAYYPLSMSYGDGF